MYCRTISPDFVESASRTVPISTCNVQKLTLISRKNRLDLDSGNSKDLKCVRRRRLSSVVCGLWSVVCGLWSVSIDSHVQYIS